MNPQNNPPNPANDQTPGLTLPPVDPDQVSSQPAEPSLAAPAPAVAPPVDPGLATPPAAPPASPTASPTGDPALPAQGASPLIADDNDLIEKEWVEKAKQLVEQTKGDPYKQNQEMNKFKASYIKKRYNKDIHLSKD